MNLFRWIAFSLFLVSVARAETPNTILFFGDSLTAGYGLDDPSRAFPGLIQEKIDAEKLSYRAVNAGLSGETTAGGLRRLAWILRQPVSVFVLELGGNDGLRGLPPEKTEENLQAIIDRVHAKNPATKIILAGMLMPANLGADYVKSFAAVYPALAKKNALPFIPFILDGVGGHPDLNQPDGIHPTAEGHKIVADNVWKTLRPAL
jgi:acyl-CoA thioesterase-1